MIIGIVGAMKEETAQIINSLENKEKVTINTFDFFTGSYLGQNVVVVTSGIGKVFAAILATTLITNFKIDLLINVGVAGGVKGKVNLRDVVIGRNIVYGDVNLTNFSSYSFGELPNCPRSFSSFVVGKQTYDLFNVINADIVTTDTFMTSSEVLDDIISTHFNDLEIVACDMESAAFAQTAYVLGVDFLIIRGISDLVGSANTNEEYSQTNLLAASKNSIFVLEDVLHSIK